MLIRPITKEERLQSAQLLTIESGDLTISAADDAIHCDYTLQIGAEGTDGPAISITDCDEGLEAAARTRALRRTARLPFRTERTHYPAWKRRAAHGLSSSLHRS